MHYSGDNASALQNKILYVLVLRVSKVILCGSFILKKRV